MKKFVTILIGFGVFFLLVFDQINLFSNQAAPPAGHTGAPGESNCGNAGCHPNSVISNSTFLNYGSISSVNNIVDGYTPGAKYNLYVNLNSNTQGYGFEMTAVDSNGDGAGTFMLSSPSLTTLSNSGGREYVGHKNASSVNAWAFKWEAPSCDIGPISFYIAGLGTDNDQSEAGDVTYLLSDTISALGSCSAHHVTINSGWNIISSYMQPDTPDMAALFAPIANDINIVKNNSGQALIPSLSINQIGNWDVTQGYKVKANNATSLNICCTQVDPASTPIALNRGWNLVSYLRTTPMDVATALSSISSDILLAKDYQGNTYIPQLLINDIGDMLPGQGYKIKMANAAVLTYPAN